ncbi:MAG: hypothetical protein VKK59_07645 [Vampirovibrionales bacterium]|nr:hypothetical protein [Vampirovibrionales bacterium]
MSFALPQPTSSQALVLALQAGVAPAQWDWSPFNQVLDLQPADAVITVQTGITLAQLDTVLTPHGLMWPLGFPEPVNTRLIDVLAEDRLPVDVATGWLGDLKCLPRDWVLGGETAHGSSIGGETAHGSIIGGDAGHDVRVDPAVKMAITGLTRWGGKVVKNVTGYDMRQLYVGGRHGFGVISQVTLRLVSRPSSQLVLEGTFENVHQAAQTALALAEDCRPWLTRCLLYPKPEAASGENAVRLQGVLSGHADALETLLAVQLKGYALHLSSKEALDSTNAYAASFWRYDLPSGASQVSQEHDFPYGAVSAMAAAIERLPPATPWLAWPEPAWLLSQARA